MADHPSFEDLKSQFVLTASTLPGYLWACPQMLLPACWTMVGRGADWCRVRGREPHRRIVVRRIHRYDDKPTTATFRSFLHLTNGNSRRCGCDEQRSTFICFFLVYEKNHRPLTDDSPLDISIALFIVTVLVTSYRCYARYTRKLWWHDDSAALFSALSFVIFLIGSYRTCFYFYACWVVQIAFSEFRIYLSYSRHGIVPLTHQRTPTD